MLDEEALDAAARKIWESETHPLLEKLGHAIDWPNLNKAIKKSTIRTARLAIKEYMAHVKV